VFKEFREFIARGNVLDLAVAVIIGGAFGAIVNSMIDDIIMPFIGIILGGIDFTSLSFYAGNAVILYGNFIQAIVNFLVISFAMFLVVRSYNKLQKEEQEKPETPPEPSPEVVLLTEIRDLLKETSSTAQGSGKMH
jgi:large conductance mechanosensitive channel